MPNLSKNPKKLGRDEEINPEELVRRYAAIKRVLEDNWGRIGLKLPRVRKPEAVKSILNRIPNAKWLPAFRDFPMGCLLRDGSKKVSWREVRETRQNHEEALTTEGQLSRESHSANQSAQSARTAFEAAVAEYSQDKDLKRSQGRLEQIAKQLRVEELTNEAKGLSARFQAAQVNRQTLAELLTSQEAWLARSEVVAFAKDRNKRYSKKADNFARAMAGLPSYDWLYSVRKCLSIPEIAAVPKTYWFQVFETLETIVKRTKPADLKKIELKLKKELLKQDTDPLFRSYISPQWFYMTLAFADCRGKKLRRAHIAYKVMEIFTDRCEHHSVAEGELAKHNQLV